MREEQTDTTTELVGRFMTEESDVVSAVELLMAQHREVEHLFAELEALGDDAYKKKEEVFNDIAEKLRIHTLLEEKFFYPAVKKEEKIPTLTAYEEHDVVKDLIKKIQKTKVRDESWMVKVKFLKDLVQQHVEEEESELLPAWEESRSIGDLEAVGQKMQAMLEKKPAKRTKKPTRTTSTRAKARLNGKSKRRLH